MKPSIIIPTCKTPYEIAPLMCNVEGYSLGCQVIATCKKASASINRNAGLEAATSEYIIMIDDDIAGFYDGWWDDMIAPLKQYRNIYMVSARLMDRKGNQGAMMFGGDPRQHGITEIPRCPTACIAFRKADVDDIRFDERFRGSGFEDDDFCAKLARKFPERLVVINNKCRMVHVNEQKNQGGENYEYNKALFESMWRTVRGGTKRVDLYWNIPQILHFIWIGSELPDWAQANIAEFRRLNPEFTIMVHGEEILNPMLQFHYARIDHKEHSLAIKSDLLRLSALMKFGGWYFDTDFWPLVSLREICDNLDDCAGKVLLFSSPDKRIVANGVLACTPNDEGLKVLVNRILGKVNPPEWWDYGTECTNYAVRTVPQHYCINPLSKIIPHVGKAGALLCMRSWERINATKAAGAWAIHMEMTTTTDAEGLCTTANSDKTSGSTKKSSKAKKAVPSWNAAPLTE